MPEGDDIVLLHVAGGEVTAAHGALAGLLGRGRRGPDLDALTAEAVGALLDRAARRLGRSARTEQRTGRVEREVVAAAEDASVLICARDGDRSRLGPRSLGPATRFVVDHVPCPVLLVWPGEAPGVDSIPPPPPPAPSPRLPRRTSGTERRRLPPLRSPDPLDDGVEQRPHRREVAVGRRPGGVDVRVAVDVLPAQPVAGVAGELREERALGAAVALPEGMQRVDLGEQRRQAVEERRRGRVRAGTGRRRGDRRRPRRCRRSGAAGRTTPRP